jgi:hypothetical protein
MNMKPQFLLVARPRQDEQISGFPPFIPGEDITIRRDPALQVWREALRRPGQRDLREEHRNQRQTILVAVSMDQTGQPSIWRHLHLILARIDPFMLERGHI